MTTTLNDTQWNSAWDAILDKIAILRTRSSSIERADAIVALLDCLEGFAKHQVGYFYSRFTKGEIELPTGLIDPHDGMPTIHDAELLTKPDDPNSERNTVMTTILEQVGFDLDVVRKVIEARMGSNKRYTISVPQYAKLADYLAQEALKPAVQMGLLDKPLPLVFTYFIDNDPGTPKTLQIRLIPYANVALIGLPSPKKNDGANGLTYGDLLAIPHEVGHYVFWHGMGIRTTSFVDPEKKDNVDAADKLALEATIFNYQEEIFADLYSALVAGPLTALSCLYYQNKSLANDHTSSGHPAPVVRPYTYIYAYQKLQENASTGNTFWGIWANALKVLWESELTKTELPFAIKYDAEKYLSRQGGQPDAAKISAVNNENVDVAVLKTRMQEVVDKMMEYFTFPEKGVGFWKPFFGNYDNKQGLDKTFEGENYLFKDFIASVKAQKIPESASSGNGFSCIDYTDLVKKWRGEWGLVEPEWVRIFKAAGWTTEGPSNPWTTD